MVDVRYDHRLVCDSDFIEWLSNYPQRSIIGSHLMHIKGSSAEHKKDHNVILDSEAKKCSSVIIKKEGIGKIFKVVEDPPYMKSYKNDISKNIIFCINLTFTNPWRCYMFTSPEKKEQYENNTHRQKVKSIKIMAGEEAVEIIENYFKRFCFVRDFKR